MISTFICFHCGSEVPCNPRIKHQKYCGAKHCQQARIRSWKNKQYKTNRKYKSKSLASQKAWRSKHPAYKYQREYRGAHPEYVTR